MWSKHWHQNWNKWFQNIKFEQLLLRYNSFLLNRLNKKFGLKKVDTSLQRKVFECHLNKTLRLGRLLNTHSRQN